MKEKGNLVRRWSFSH